MSLQITQKWGLLTPQYESHFCR